MFRVASFDGQFAWWLAIYLFYFSLLLFYFHLANKICSLPTPLGVVWSWVLLDWFFETASRKHRLISCCKPYRVARLERSIKMRYWPTSPFVSSRDPLLLSPLPSHLETGPIFETRRTKMALSLDELRSSTSSSNVGAAALTDGGERRNLLGTQARKLT